MHFSSIFLVFCLFVFWFVFVCFFLTDFTRSLEDINLSVFFCILLLLFVCYCCCFLLLFLFCFLGGVLFSWGVFLLGNSGSRRGRIHFFFFNSINEPALKRFPLCFATKIRLPSKGPKRFTFTFCRQSNFVPELLCGPG